jgi:uncharacterized protein YdaU (DUF1376 family)
MTNDIKYVQLEPAAFLTDIDFQMMDAEQRGVYCSIIFYLYCNGGKIELDGNTPITLLENKTHILAVIAGCLKIGPEWDGIWAKIGHKFQITGNILTHKRVTEELKRVENFKKTKQDAGRISAQKRWGSNTPITKLSKVKVSKKSKSTLIPPTFEEVKSYIKENNYDVDPKKFFDYFTEGGWVDSKGKPVRNWKQKIITWSGGRVKEGVPKKTKLFPITGKVCSERDCGLPAVYKSIGGAYDFFYCTKHLPAKVKELYE